MELLDLFRKGLEENYEENGNRHLVDEIQCNAMQCGLMQDLGEEEEGEEANANEPNVCSLIDDSILFP